MTLFKFLLGERSAIQEIASNQSSLLIGLVFVISAGFAREYDQEDLLHEPWYLFIPLGASILSSLILYLIIRITARQRGDQPAPFFSSYRSFLSLYWMTAPLAWLYAIPYEEFLSAPESVNANLRTLFVVAAWRVLLITRIVTILYGTSWKSAFCVVMFFADSLAMAVLYFTDLPIFNIMGGVHITQSERVILNTAFIVGFWGWLSLPLWTIGTIVIGRIKPKSVEGPLPWHLKMRSFSKNGIHISLILPGLVSLLIWIPLLYQTQPKQINRYHAEKLLYSGKIDEGVSYMTSRDQSDFPIYWVPPPRVGYGEREPRIEKVFIKLLGEDETSWVFQLYLQDILSRIYWKPSYFGNFFKAEVLSIEELKLLVDWMKSHPEEGSKFALLLERETNNYLEKHPTDADDPEYKDLYQAYQSILELVPEEEPESD